MAQTIKGINVVIGAETQGLSKALSDVNKKSRDIQSELRQVEKLLKLDPSNVQLVAQKQQLLAEAVDNARQKLDRLKSVQQQIADQLSRGEITPEAYRAYQREVARAEQELKRFENQLRDVGDATEDVGKKSNSLDFSDKLKGLVNPATIAAGAVAAIGVAAAGVAKEAAKMAIEWDNASRKMAAATGLPIAKMKEFEEQAEKIYINGRGSVDEIYEAMAKLEQSFHLSAEETGKLADKALVLKEVFGYDVAESVRAVDSMVKNFGIDGSTAFDIITRTSQLAGDKADDLLDTFNEYSPQFASMGIGAETFAGILVKGAQEGAFNMDKVADAVGEFNKRAGDGSKTTADGFAAIGLNADEMGASIRAGGEQAQQAFIATVAGLASIEDPLKRDQAGVALFGTQWEDLRGKVITAMTDGKTALGDFSGSTDEAAEKIDGGLGQTLERIGKKFGLLAKHLGEQLKPSFEEFAKAIEQSMPAIEAIVLITVDAIMTAFAIFMDFLKGDFQGIITEAKGFAVDTFAKLGVDIGAELEKLKKSIEQTWNNIKITAAKKWGEIVTITIDTFSTAISRITEVGKNIVEGLWEGIKSMTSWIYDKVSDFVGGLVDEAESKLGINSPSKVFADIGKNVSLGLAEGIAGAEDAVQRAMSGITSNMQIQASLGMVGGGSSVSHSTVIQKIEINGVSDPEAVFDELMRQLRKRGVHI